jgi:hypothetical protein
MALIYIGPNGAPAAASVCVSTLSCAYILSTAVTLDTSVQKHNGRGMFAKLTLHCNTCA